MTPTCVRSLYKIPSGHLAKPGNELGVYEQGSFYDSSDMKSFLKHFAPWVPAYTRPKLVSIDGGKAPQSCKPTDANCGEADLDNDIAVALVYPQDVINYQVDDQYYGPREYIHNYFNTFLDALDGSYCTHTAYNITGDSPGIDPVYPDPHRKGFKSQLQCGVYTPAKAISISYGQSERDFSQRYEARQCNEFMKLGLQGTSIFVSSGDYGVGIWANDASPDGCLNSTDPDHPHLRVFNPPDPATCPYVTSVGGTRLYPGQTVGDAESVMDIPEADPTFGSGGGFSNVYDAPAYQREAIEEYFTHHDPGYAYYYANATGNNYGESGGRYNRAGRGFPDVSANGAYYQIPVNGTLESGPWASGTSVSTPIWASVITLINEERAAMGKSSVGFINPVLYAHAYTCAAVTDIVNGSNPNCGTKGFPAVAGWDPSSGLGTPNYPELLRMFMDLP